MKLEDILPEIRKGRRARRKGWPSFWSPEMGNWTAEDLLADDWELEPETIPDGIYDNQSAAYREWFKGGKLVKSEQAILHWDKKRRPWGSYPDRPKITE